jgi:hypothetical protein
MVEDFLSMWRSLQGASHNATGSSAKRETDGEDVLRAHPQWYRAEAEEWERLARQVSLIPDREYFLAYAGELRAKAAALEANPRRASDNGY